uniref:Ig-like domain-containing protein n=1 Tax=Anas platyrhynchos platyrhynchos TaxID=8840 RepID=A0A493SU00_ANAPP
GVDFLTLEAQTLPAPRVLNWCIFERAVSLGVYRLARESTVPGGDHCSLASGRPPLEEVFVWAGGRTLCSPCSPCLHGLPCHSLLMRHAVFARHGRRIPRLCTPQVLFLNLQGGASMAKAARSWWLPQVGSIMKKHSPACPILCSAAERLAREYCMEHCVGMLHRVGKRAQPQVRIIPAEMGNARVPVRLSCHIWGFYPPEVTVIWLHNGDIVEPDDYNPISAIPNGDWSYQMQVSVLVAPVAGDTYTCSVQHVSLQEPLLEDWSEWRGAGPQPEAGCLGTALETVREPPREGYEDGEGSAGQGV